jgi:hypothetical protein
MTIGLVALPSESGSYLPPADHVCQLARGHQIGVLVIEYEQSLVVAGQRRLKRRCGRGIEDAQRRQRVQLAGDRIALTDGPKARQRIRLFEKDVESLQLPLVLWDISAGVSPWMNRPKTIASNGITRGQHSLSAACPAQCASTLCSAQDSMRG